MIAVSETEPVETREYYERLAEFTRLCDDLVGRGFAYLAVVLCHELYRFLYPVEPHAGYVADDPVPFVTRRLEALVEEGRRFAGVVAPYGGAPGVGLDPASRSLGESTSQLYDGLWQAFDEATVIDESQALMRRRLPGDLIDRHIAGRSVLDMGCGSGRYAVALARTGAAAVTAIDWRATSYAAARAWCRRSGAPVRFVQGDVLRLPFAPESFDFVFSNGVLHHTESIAVGLGELARVLRRKGAAFLYLYGAGGIFWNTRRALREVFANIPIGYTQQVLRMIGMPANRFIFCDTWYVPRETHTTERELRAMLDTCGFRATKLTGRNDFDLDGAIDRNVAGARAMWGDGEHRYLLEKR